MKIYLLNLLALGLFLCSACEKGQEELLSDDNLIEAIAGAEKQPVEANALPAPAQNALVQESGVLTVEAALHATGLGYEVAMRGQEETRDRRNIYFNLKGRRLGDRVRNDAYDCPRLQANFRDRCRLGDGTVGVVNGDCECQVRGGEEEYDCPRLQANFRDRCRLGDGTVGVINGDCECVSN